MQQRRRTQLIHPELCSHSGYLVERAKNLNTMPQVVNTLRANRIVHIMHRGYANAPASSYLNGR